MWFMQLPKDMVWFYLKRKVHPLLGIVIEVLFNQFYS